MAITADYIVSSVDELREMYRPWVEQERLLARMVQPAPGVARTSAQLVGRVQSDPGHALAIFDEWVSGRVALIKANLVGRATNVPPKIEPAVLAGEKPELDRQRRLFQLVGGFHNVLNDQTQTVGEGTSWDRAVMEQGATYGKHVGMPHVGWDGKALTVSCALLDPLCCYADYGSWPRRFVHEQQVGGEAARAELERYGRYARFEAMPDVTGELRGGDGKYRSSVTFVDFWCEEERGGGEFDVWHGFMVNGVYAGHFLTDFDHIPPVIVSTHAQPGSGQDFAGGGRAYTEAAGTTRGVSYDRVMGHAGPFYAPLYYIWLQERQMMSEAMEGLSRGANPGIEVVRHEDTLEEGPAQEQIGHGGNWEHSDKIEARLQPQSTAQIGEVVRVVAERVEREYDRLYNPVLFGVSAPGDSGYLTVEKVSHAIATVQEPLKGASIFVKRVMDELLHQFVRARASFSVRGWRQYGKGAPQFFAGGDFSYRDVPKQYILNVEVLFDLPQSDAVKLEIASKAVMAGLMSKREAATNIMDNPDWDRTLELLAIESYEADPMVIARRHRYQMRQEVLDLRYEASRAKTLAERNALLLEAAEAEQDYQVALDQMMGEQVRQPAVDGGLSPETMPPELGVGTNADRNAAAQGRVSSYTGGKPRTVEARV